MSAQSEDLLTYREVQAELRVSRETVRRMTLRGDLTPIKLGTGRTVRVKLAEVNALVNGERKAADAA